MKSKGHFGGHHPSFRVEELASGRWWILDGDVEIGLVTRPEDFAELVNFNPLSPRRNVSFPEIYHAPTAPGDRITMAKWISAQSTASTSNSLRFDDLLLSPVTQN